MEMHELISEVGFGGDETLIILRSVLCTLEGKKPEAEL